MKRSDGTEKPGRPSALSISPRVESRWRIGLKLFRRMAVQSTIIGQYWRGQNVRATRRKAGMDITWVTDRIAVGGGIWNADNMATVSRAGITHIIDMQIEFDDTPLAQTHGIAVCWNPVDDDFEPKPAEYSSAAWSLRLAALEEEGAKLFVHCAAGVHRAPMMTLALLGVMGWTVEDAMDLIEGRRPAADFAEVYVRSVEDFLKGQRVRSWWLRT